MKLKVKKQCYVCGLKLDEFPYDAHYFTSNASVICPCCGIHYGYDDDGAGNIIPDELTYSKWKFGDQNHKKIIKYWRTEWINGGMKWWGEGFGKPDDRKPQNWNPKEQLKNIPKEFLGTDEAYQ